MYGKAHRDLSRFLLTRGAWTFNFAFAHYMLAGVIWMIGWCMILMAGLMRLPASWVGAIGLVGIAAGYAFGTIMLSESGHRRRVCVGIGLSAVALCVMLRGFNPYGDPRPWKSSGGAFAFLNATKYPASFSFLLMTLGARSYHLRPSAVFLLPAPHPADPRVGAGCSPIIRWETRRLRTSSIWLCGNSS